MMTLTLFQWYLLAINAAAFVLYTIDFHIYVHGGEGVKPEVLLNLVTILGGSLGTFAAETLWDPKLNKRNAQSKIYTVVWLIIHIALVLVLYGPNHALVQERLYSFYKQHVLLCWYAAVINVATFVVFAVDKVKAIRKKWRIREAVLFGMSLAGGAVGGLLAMDICNHKVNKMHFMVGIPLILCAHLVALVCLLLGVI